ncbi:DUF2177 family protein [Notoacmeibacter sp. MSK16QG-6]|uniref:DUF2177 family protein n=1 Tax=Notoacmeibacter sp. MSK16QG-6 TaxID=2957982 RepID=UPI00209E12A8|nr:DUF2177 family protein [Notoacmeibacter sp. MSK16QG-6]MCP1199323.1 DUF2177 family protein [Notoacmeibacter sp. MSK16QG-6]
MRPVYLYLIALVIFFTIDFVWLGFVAKNFYAERMGAIMRDSPKLSVAALFYAVYVIGLIYFAVWPAFNGGGWTQAALNGAFFGFFAYLTYDATSYSVVEGFDPVVAVVDTVWGTIITGFTAATTVWIGALIWEPSAS